MTKRSPFQPPQRKPEQPKTPQTEEFSLEDNDNTVDNEHTANPYEHYEHTANDESTAHIDDNVNTADTEHIDYSGHDEFVLDNGYPAEDSEFGDYQTTANANDPNDDAHYAGEDEIDYKVEDSYPVDEEPKDKKGKKIALIIAGVVVAVAVAVAGGVYYVQSQETLIPVAQAQEYVSYADTDDLCADFATFSCKTVWEFSDLNNGQLISQSIAPGEELAKGEEIVLTYSKGPERAIVPNIVGLTEEDGRQKLYNLGFKVNNINKIDAPGQQAGTIVEVSGAVVGEEAVNGSIINLSVANGKITVPDWTGKTKEYVQSESDNMNLDVIFTEEESAEPAGTVISQSVNAKEINEGDAIEVVIAKGFEEVQVVIPDVLQMSMEEAQSVLAANGFRKIVTVVVKNNEVTTPQVTNVVPGVGSEVSVEENITIIFSEPEKDAGEESTTVTTTENA